MRSMIKIMAAAASVSLISLGGFGAQAMPAQGTVGSAPASPQLTLVAQGCGRGFARGPGGGCRPIGRVIVGGPAVVVARPAVVVRRPVVVVRPGCGVRIGPIGVRTPC